MRGVPVVWDAFISLYNSVTEDRRLVGPRNPVAWMLYAWEWLACLAAQQVLIDTRAHGEYLVDHIRLPSERIKAVFDCIHRADECLGIYGDTDKAVRVIPKKVFQILTACEPLVTRDSASVRELVSAECCGLALVPPADPAALVAVIRHVAGDVLRRQE